MTQRGNIETDCVRRFENRETFLKLVGLTINNGVDQNQIFRLIVTIVSDSFVRRRSDDRRRSLAEPLLDRGRQ